MRKLLFRFFEWLQRHYELLTFGPQEPSREGKGLCPRCRQPILVGDQLELGGQHLAHGTLECNGGSILDFWGMMGQDGPEPLRGNEDRWQIRYDETRKFWVATR